MSGLERQVGQQEAQAIERCLKAESTVQAQTPERIRVVHFAERTPRALNALRDQEHLLQVRLFESSRTPDRVTLEVVRLLSDGVRRTTLELPRRALRPALRRHARAELLPNVSGDLVPALGVECTRRRWTSTAGWSLCIDRDLSLHRIDPDLLERTGRLALGLPDRCLDGAAVVTLECEGQAVPAWLEHLVASAERWSPLGDGLVMVAPRPVVRPEARDLHLV